MRRNLVCWVILALASFGLCAAEVSSNSAKSTIHAEASFTCLWWSQSQMEGLNPNSPPPKNTEVQITKWEYSDPIGIPHPDQVQLVISLSNMDALKPSEFDVEILGEWKNGPMQRSKNAAWGRPTVLKQFHAVSLDPSGKQTLKLPIDLKSTMNELSKSHQWPFAFRSTIVVRKAHSSELLAKTTTTLPITPGD